LPLRSDLCVGNLHGFFIVFDRSGSLTSKLTLG
jgi:hypothetical protein